jgi:hypothetical protein
MCANGVRSFALLCWTCRDDAVLPIAVLMSRDRHASHVADVYPGAAMGFEIERKFLLRGSEWQQIATEYTDIRQAYLTLGGPQHD